MLEDLAPLAGFQGMGYIGRKPLIMVTEGSRVVVRVVVPIDWLVLQ